MSLIKRKLGSKAGASMLLAMVFLMFCLFIGGSVLAAATANGSRVAHLKNDQQDYLSQRSAMLLMADMLTGEDGKELQVVITDVVKTTKDASGTESSTRTMTFTCPTPMTGEPTLPQKLLFEIVVANEGQGNIKSDTLKVSAPNTGTTADNLRNGTIKVTVKENPADLEPIEMSEIKYSVDLSDYTLSMEFVTDGTMVLTMDGSVGKSTEKKVTIGSTKTITTTKVIRWSAPVVEKRGT